MWTGQFNPPKKRDATDMLEGSGRDLSDKVARAALHIISFITLAPYFADTTSSKFGPKELLAGLGKDVPASANASGDSASSASAPQEKVLGKRGRFLGRSAGSPQLQGEGREADGVPPVAA